VIYVNLDDSLGVKHPETRHLEPVDWHYDHGASSGHGQRRYNNAICYLVCTLRIGQLQATVDLCLYVRASTQRRINRLRPRRCGSGRSSAPSRNLPAPATSSWIKARIRKAS
jgi:hypothetical protein